MDDILAKAEQIAIKHKVEFVGSEHLLMAMLVSNNQFTDWLNQENISKQTISALEKVLKEIIVLKNTCEQSESGQQHDHSDYENLETPGFLMRSPCLTRTISIISSIQSGNFSAGIQVLLGILISHKEFPNAAGSALLYVSHGDASFSTLLNNLPFSEYKTNSISSRTKDQFLTWSDPILATEETKSKSNSLESKLLMVITDDFPNSPLPDKTHWIVPGRILAGSSPNDMTKPELLDIIESGIDTFVNLQMAYDEYSYTDYRKILRNMAASDKKFPPHQINFLHCPIRDHGYLGDKNMWQFIEELIKILEVDHRNIYIHCYGGHGRTGSVLLHLLQALFGIDKNSAMKVIKRSHEKRDCWAFCALNRGKLESSSQNEQAERMELIMYNRRKNIRRLQKSLDDKEGG